MINYQTLNQLYLTILALILTSLFVGTMSLSASVGSKTSDKFWRRSLGARALSYFSWAALPIAGPLMAVGANMLFVFSGGCLALLFRSWRREVSTDAQWAVFLFAVLVGGTHLILLQTESSYLWRLIVTGSASLFFSAWELSELVQLSRRDSEKLLKLIIAVVVLQILMSLGTVASTIYYANGTQRFLTDNVSKSVYAIWCTFGVHLIVYLVIGSYLYRKAIVSQLSAVSEKNSLSALLDERERLLSSLIAANRIASSGALSASLAHEISQPLTASLMQLGLMKRIVEKKKDVDPALASLLKNALQDISRSKQVLENMRAIFRRSPRNRKPCDLDQLVSQTAMILQRRVQESNVRLVYPSGLSIHAEAVDLEIQQVLINLVNNAVDALETKGSGPRTIWIDLVDTPGWAIVSVCDNGSGVLPELAESLFDLASSGKHGGMGIGLWISKHIVEERHHGRLWLDTHYTSGARFVMELPKPSPTALSQG